MSDSDPESDFSEVGEEDPANNAYEEQISFTESLLNNALEEDEENYSDNSIYNQAHENNGIYHESSENRVLRETMEQMVSSAIPQETSSSPDDDIIVLSPEHPMLQSFHVSVGIHLNKQKDLLSDDIRELSAKVKAHRSEADDKAETLYGLQQTANRQRSQLDAKCENLTTDVETRQELEKMVQELKEKHIMERSMVQKEQICEENLWRKLNERTEKEYEARKKKEEEDLQLAIVRRATEKAQIDKKLLVEEKKKQDEFVYRLTCEVTELQSRHSQLKAQLQAKLVERSRLQQATMSAAEDLEVQSGEHQRLMQAWQRLLVNAKQKDEAHTKLISQKELAEEEKRLLNVKIEGYRKAGTEEMLRNEQLTLCVHRLEGGVRECEKQLTKEKIVIEEEQIKLDGVNNMLKLTEQDLSKAAAELRERQEKRKVIDKEIADLNCEQHKLEQKILETLNDQATQDKEIYNIIKSVEKKNRELEDLETQVSQKESSVAAMGVDLQNLRFQEACTSQLVTQHQATVSKAQEEVSSVEQQLRQAQLELAVKQSALDRLNTKFNKLLIKTGGKEISVTEMTVKELEDKVGEITKEIDHLQRQLLRKEVILLDETKILESLKKKTAECKTNISHLQHKSLAQKTTIEKENLQAAQLKRKTEMAIKALTSVDKELAKLRELKENLEKENTFTFKDIMAARKEEEQEMAQLESRLADLEEERKKLQENVDEYQHQQVDLENKVKLATEAKQAIEHERSSSGEIAALKSEIHRMEVRLSQLKRAQDGLTQDLEQCVLRRDAMVDSARARNTRHAGTNMAQIKTTRKLENLKHSNRLLRAKIHHHHSDNAAFQELEKEIKELESGVKQKKIEIAQLEESHYGCNTKLDNLMIKKKQNLERLVHEQKRCRGLSDAKDGRYKPSCRSEAALLNEAQRQRVIRANLLSVVESLRPDFPMLNSQLSCITALLKSIKIVYSTDPTTTEEASENN